VAGYIILLIEKSNFLRNLTVGCILTDLITHSEHATDPLSKPDFAFFTFELA